MQLLLLAPLFPPDTGDPAEYAKELCSRLQENTLTALIYGHLPEAVSGVQITAIDKRQWLPKRLLSYTIALYSRAKVADAVIVNNAPSTELPMLLVSLFLPVKIIMCESDPLAQKASTTGFYHLVHKALVRRSKKTFLLPDEHVYKRAEVLPFSEQDKTQTEQREVWWRAHVNELTTI
jgi:hypothetical protein